MNAIIAKCERCRAQEEFASLRDVLNSKWSVIIAGAKRLAFCPDHGDDDVVQSWQKGKPVFVLSEVTIQRGDAVMGKHPKKRSRR